MSGALLDERVIVIQPSLVRALGTHALAAFAQQVHFRAQVGPERDGFRWARATMNEWATDVVMSHKQVKAAVAKLTELGVLITTTDATYDRTAWRRLDYDRLEDLVGTNASVPNGTNGGGPNGTNGMVPGGTAVPLFEEQIEEPQEPASLTPGELAARIQADYWKWVEGKTGRKPIALTAPGFKAIITPFLEAGIDGPPIKVAVAAIYERGETLTKAGLERELDGRGHRRSAGQPTPRQALRFDEHGNRIRESSSA